MGISEGILEAGPLPKDQAMEILGKGGINSLKLFQDHIKACAIEISKANPLPPK